MHWIIFLFSTVYWAYLACHTHMLIECDAISYENLGKLLHEQGIIPYLTTGPNREPLYPFLVSLSFHIQDSFHIAYTKIMAFFGLFILLCSQVLMFLLMKQIRIKKTVINIILIIFAVSPSINNSAFSLYSEIATYPFILGIILLTGQLWQNLQKNKFIPSIAYSASLSLLLAMLTFSKAIFELITPIYLFITFSVLVFFASSPKPKIKILFSSLLILFSVYYIPVLAYKSLNKHYNGNFAITNRGSWALYGNTARRMEKLTPQRFLSALAYAPGAGACQSFFSKDACDFWSFVTSDSFATIKTGEMLSAGFSPQQIDQKMITMSKDLVLSNPFQYTLLMSIEGLKMFFWESTQIGFVSYPHWLENIYEYKPFNNVLRLSMALFSFLGFFSLMFRRKQLTTYAETLAMIIFITLYITSYSFFYILTRYALPIAPLYLVMVGILLQQLPIKSCLRGKQPLFGLS